MKIKKISNYITKAFLLVGLIAVMPFASAQENNTNWRALDIEAIFALARTHAFENKREQAREMLVFILNDNPNYTDARILFARTLAWENRFTEAREELKRALNSSPKNEDAYQALVDVEIWSKSFESALSISNQALAYYPTNANILLKKAMALHELSRDEEALVILTDILTINPGNHEAALFRQNIKTNKLKYHVGVNYGVDIFNRSFDPAQNLSIHLGKTTKWGSALARINYSNRFNQSGIQPEIEVYPRISKGIYAYLNYGYSNSILFPKHRSGAEFFFSLPKSIELSGGIRSLYFNTNNTTTILTTSASWYFKSNWLSWRSYIIPSTEIGTSYSLTLSYRKYFKDNNTYLTVNAGAGYSPDERRIQNSSGLSSDQIFKLKSQRIGILFQKSLERNFIIGANIEIINQELIFDLDDYVLITSTGLMLRKRF